MHKHLISLGCYPPVERMSLLPKSFSSIQKGLSLQFSGNILKTKTYVQFLKLCTFICNIYLGKHYSQDYQGKVLAEGSSIKAEIRRRNTVIRQEGEVLVGYIKIMHG